MVEYLAHGVNGRRIDPLRCIPRIITRSSQCSTTGVIKTVVCVILSIALSTFSYGYMVPDIW